MLHQTTLSFAPNSWFSGQILLLEGQVCDRGNGWGHSPAERYSKNTMSASKPQESVEVRIEHSLNEKEKEFVAKRRKAVLESLQKLQIHCSQTEVPNIALLGSGGGQRAMMGLLGSLVQLQKAGLLDCVLYLSGVSGSTWCMASLYQEPDWSTELETVKDKIIQRLNGPGVSWTDAFDKLKKYYGKDIFSMTDVWAAMFVTNFVKESSPEANIS
ncbi:cytosolic phospholipase A2 gamma-like isoform X2 [Megalobrama amblycephala]|uniref:cytosolic phospholipase A2 gamma-like isoform X2 n=1 Tax=Megalobrama amblycephala TaxID=75352 RepID=UPI0020147A5A|nr:cytosolic phospholipase A2 gamma-like isoform X2 [Megalobrama amblycephala]XP_048042739.1 cytosolic phospholipase A2 gamma-like isoform X2 [Megalobrama amblycephala]